MVADFPAEIAADRVVVLEMDDVVQGYMIAWAQADAYYVDNIAVDPPYQGCGLGRRLIEHAASQATRLRLPALRLFTNVVMTENLSMYRHMGFIETHRKSEQGFDRIYMRRDLANRRT